MWIGYLGSFVPLSTLLALQTGSMDKDWLKNNTNKKQKNPIESKTGSQKNSLAGVYVYTVDGVKSALRKGQIQVQESVSDLTGNGEKRVGCGRNYDLD